MARPIEIIEGIPPTKVLGRGRPRGGGCNQLLLEEIKPNGRASCIWGVGYNKMESIRASAAQNGMKIKIRRLENKKYAIWRLT